MIVRVRVRFKVKVRVRVRVRVRVLMAYVVPSASTARPFSLHLP